MLHNKKRLKMKTVIAYLLCLFGSIHLAMAQHNIEGVVMLNDSTPAVFATVYVPNLEMGTITDWEGHYLLEGMPLQQEIKIEFSHVGYTPVSATFNPLLPTDTITLQEQTINLNEVFITPNGENPAIYILNKVKEQAKSNMNAMQGCRYTIQSTFHSQDLDFVPTLLPKSIMWMLKAAIALTKLGDLFDYCVSHEQLTAKGEIKGRFEKGKHKHESWRLLSVSNTIDKDVEKSLKSISEITPFSFYNWIIDAKPQKLNFELVGTTEENGRQIDILSSKSQYDTTYYYVVENDWGIIRQESRSIGGLSRVECREIMPHIWLPVSLVDDPKLIDLNAIIKKELAEYEKEQGSNKKRGRMEKKMLERAQKIANGERSFHPCMTQNFYISYKTE